MYTMSQKLDPVTFLNIFNRSGQVIFDTKNNHLIFTITTLNPFRIDINQGNRVIVMAQMYRIIENMRVSAAVYASSLNLFFL